MSQADPHADEAAPPRGSWWQRNWKWVAPVGCLLPIVLIGGSAIGLVFGLLSFIKSSDAYTRSLAAVRADKSIQDALGEPIQPAMLVTGQIQVANNSGHADLAYQISGPKGEGFVHAVADKVGGQWIYKSNRVFIKASGQEIEVPVNPSN